MVLRALSLLNSEVLLGYALDCGLWEVGVALCPAEAGPAVSKWKASLGFL